MSPPVYDVIIVGARPAGAATAMLLARSGLDVLVVDRAIHGDDTLSMGLLQPGAVVQLDRWGLLPRLDAARTPRIRHLTVEVDGRRERQVPSEPLLAPRRTVLDPILVGAARHAGAKVRYGITVDAVTPGRHGRVGGVVGRTADGGRFQATARLVVGADGRRSRIARLVGAPVLHRGTSSSAIVYRYIEAQHRVDYQRIYRGQTTAGLVATNRRQSCIWVGAPSVRLPTAAGQGVEAWFHSTLEDTAPRLAAQVATAAASDLSLFRGAPSVLRQPWGAGWALVGDAGSFTDPASGHGLAAALRDAELLTDAIVATVRDRHDEHTAMRGYREQRDRLTLPILAVTDAIATYDWHPHQLSDHLAELETALGAVATYLRQRESVGTAELGDWVPAGGGIAAAARSTTELATIVIEAENTARYAAIATAHGDGTARSAAGRYRRRLPEARQTVAAARGLLHELIDHEYELLCAIENESS